METQLAKETVNSIEKMIENFIPEPPIAFNKGIILSIPNE